MQVSDNIQQLQQALYEALSWGRMLDYFLQESAYLKNRLSQVIDNTANVQLIVSAEHFQTFFIHSDTQMNDLKNDVEALEKLISDCLAGKNNFQQRMTQHKNRITKDMINFEKQFVILKDEFNQFLKGSVEF